MKKNGIPIFFLSLLLLSFIKLTAQNYTISGYVQEAKSGEKLINANVYDEASLKGTITNVYGFYSLTLPKGKHTIIYSYIGFGMVRKEINLTEDLDLTVSLEQNLMIEEVLVAEKSSLRKVESSQMSLDEIPVKTINQLPVLFGEADVIKTVQLLPGVQSGMEGAS